MALDGEAHRVGSDGLGEVAEPVTHEAVADCEVGGLVLTLKADATSEARGEGHLLARCLGSIDVVSPLDEMKTRAVTRYGSTLAAGRRSS